MPSSRRELVCTTGPQGGEGGHAASMSVEACVQLQLRSSGVLHWRGPLSTFERTAARHLLVQLEIHDHTVSYTPVLNPRKSHKGSIHMR